MSKETIQRKLNELRGNYDDQWSRLKRGLPHRYLHKFYNWSRFFFESTNKTCLLTAANQIGKSTIQIKKCIDWATDKKKWPTLWPNKTPQQFWYLYPDKDTAHREWVHKWLDLMPSEEFKDHPQYGWKEVYNQRKIESVAFNSGVTVYFRTYSQDPKNLQSGTVDAIFCDEELPEHLYPELVARLFAARGYFSMVFTATLNQDMWRRAVEGVGDAELFPDAHKQQVSMRDCITYEDGTPGAFSEEDIRHIEAQCKDEVERQRRVDGKFVTEHGRKYQAFDPLRHYIKPFTIPSEWQRRMAVDIGGGGKSHPPAVVFIAIRPDFRRAVVYKAWCGDDGSNYTAGDIFQKAEELALGEDIAVRKFDQNAKDYGVIAERAGTYYEASEKSHELGEAAVNTLFKNDMLHLFADDYEIAKLGSQLTSLLRDGKKKDMVDDLADALRYCVTDAPWDWRALKGLPSDEEKAKAIREKQRKPLSEKELLAIQIRERRGAFVDEKSDGTGNWSDIDAEIAEWNDLYG